MAEQPGEPRDRAETREELLRRMVPGIDPELVRLVLGYAARSADEHAELVELLALIRDSGIDRARLHALLGLDPEVPPGYGDTRPPAR